jgi:hypothetical protein
MNEAVRDLAHITGISPDNGDWLGLVEYYGADQGRSMYWRDDFGAGVLGGGVLSGVRPFFFNEQGIKARQTLREESAKDFLLRLAG